MCLQCMCMQSLTRKYTLPICDICLDCIIYNGHYYNRRILIIVVIRQLYWFVGHGFDSRHLHHVWCFYGDVWIWQRINKSWRDTRDDWRNQHNAINANDEVYGMALAAWFPRFVCWPCNPITYRKAEEILRFFFDYILGC